ncbi:MAG: methyltransferase family protein [Planctomycetota bacterium]
MTENSGPREGRRWMSRIGEWILKILGVFVILEPIWMLLPFAGFLYGSILHIPVLARNPSTAWLTHFVFPVLTGGWLGPVLVAVGFLVFLFGAGQIYGAKIRRTGLVTGGLYRFVRHPQYIALTLFGFGILLTWGRAITFLAFFMMMFLYALLARSEERNCIRLFGEAYERYRARTSFIFPGDRWLRPLGEKLPALPLPPLLAWTGAFLLSLAACLGLMWGISQVKETVRAVPFLSVEIPFEPEEEGSPSPAPEIHADLAGGVPFAQAGRMAVVRGPHRNAGVPGFAERVLTRLRGSDTLKEFLAFLDDPEGDVAVLFCLPFSRPLRPGTPGSKRGEGEGEQKGPPEDPDGPDRVRLMILRCTLKAGSTIGQALADASLRTVRGVCLAPVNLGRPRGAEVVEGRVFTPGPRFPAEDRWRFLLEQTAQQQEASQREGSATAVVPGHASKGTLVLVKAPILRTRRDPPFAQEILDRLSGSETFREQLRKFGVGGDLIAVAFPRPGPNWYKEHHGVPQISVFVILARSKSGEDGVASLFTRGNRELLGAFTAELDFQIEKSGNSVTGFSAIGPRRDLEERWRFFLSGL